MSDTSPLQDHLVVFSPSGRRGRFAAGTTVLSAARGLGGDLDSVCGGRGICGRCKIGVGVGDFPKHGLVSRRDHAGDRNAVEDRHQTLRGGLDPDLRLGCQARIGGDLVIDVPPESQVHRQIVRKRAEAHPIRSPELHRRPRSSIVQGLLRMPALWCRWSEVRPDVLPIERHDA